MPRRIIVGAAHTLMQPGEIYGDLKEADLTRKILQKTVPYLEKTGIEFKTVPLDLPLLKRIDWINNTGYTQAQGDVFVEIHVNDGGKRGIENWYAGEKGDDNHSQKFAEHMLNFMCDKLKYDKHGAKSETEHDLGSLLILNQTKTMSIATELLFIDNDEDIKILKDEAKLDELAKTLVDAIKAFIDEQKDKPLPPEKKQKHNPFSFGAPAPKPGGMVDPFAPIGAPSFGAPAPGGASPANKSDSAFMDRDQRKKMIEDTYKKLTGEEPKQNDLNYYLNIAISEEDLIAKLIESEEFEEMIKDAKDAKELRDKFEGLEADNARLQSQVNDLQEMHTNLQKLLQHKNHAIMQMQNELINKKLIKKGEYYDPHRTR